MVPAAFSSEWGRICFKRADELTLHQAEKSQAFRAGEFEAYTPANGTDHWVPDWVPD